MTLISLDSEKYPNTTMSYARYLLCIAKGRWLEKWEEADHINNKKDDDRNENVQILSRIENARKSAKGIAMAELVCPKCNKSFVRRRNNTHLVKGGNKTFCSRTCVGKYYAEKRT